MKYLLATTVVSDFLRGIPTVLERLRSVPRMDTAISTVTAIETEYGLRLNPSRAQRTEPTVQALFRSIHTLPFERPDPSATAAVRAALKPRGLPIGPYDAMIAGTALRRGLIMVTSNRAEFHRVVGLNVEDWRSASP